MDKKYPVKVIVGHFWDMLVIGELGIKRLYPSLLLLSGSIPGVK